jgi:signal transduction histidine kinase
MNINKRLIISNTLTVFVPIIITVAVVFSYGAVASNLFGSNVSLRSVKKFADIEAEVFNITNEISRNSNVTFDEMELKNLLEQKLRDIKGKYIIIRNSNVVDKSDGIDDIEAVRCFKEVNSQSILMNYQINNISYEVQSVAVKLSNANNASVILLAPNNYGGDIVKQLFTVGFFSFIVSAIIVSIITSYLFSARIAKPVELLKAATAEIREGNLEHEIIETGDEEIRELCKDFEVMRIQLKDSIRMKLKYDDDRKMLVSSISHDLKTPITSIKGYVEGILDGVASTPEKLEEYLKTIYSKAESIDFMIDDLLLYSKLDMNQIPFDFQKVDINEYFSFCIAESAPLLLKNNIELKLQNELSKTIYVMLDLERMKRVILNIIDNSRKYMNKEKGEIKIILRETSVSIIIEIRDNGVGVSKDEINNIFDRFYRSDSARSGSKGSGLGLAIGKQIVEGHGGQIWGISHGDEGTSIMISLGKLGE